MCSNGQERMHISHAQYVKKNTASIVDLNGMLDGLERNTKKSTTRKSWTRCLRISQLGQILRRVHPVSSGLKKAWDVII